jgi:DNA-binding transcriptional ArsR family regulator
MDEESWHVRRRRELEAAAPTKRKRAEPFVKVPLWWIEAAAKATRSPATLVMIELLHVAWKAKSSTFPLPNGRLKKLGVSREAKRRALRDLERAGLITVERPTRKTPIVSLIAVSG